jgi:hypothetical protein
MRVYTKKYRGALVRRRPIRETFVREILGVVCDQLPPLSAIRLPWMDDIYPRSLATLHHQRLA